MNASHRDPVIQPRTTFSSAKFSANNNGRHVRRYVGVNICRSNDESRYWDSSFGSNDLTFKDPGVGKNWWTFPDITKGGVQTVGWLGQVHRGTPWQTFI